MLLTAQFIILHSGRFPNAKIDKQQNVTVQNILRCLNELNDENMVYVGSQPPTETKKD